MRLSYIIKKIAVNFIYKKSIKDTKDARAGWKEKKRVDAIGKGFNK